MNFLGKYGAEAFAEKEINAIVNQVDDLVVTAKIVRGVGKTIAEYSGILRDAAKFKGNFGLGEASVSEADELGRAWVGKGFTYASDGKTLISSNGLRQFRPPSFKPRLGIQQANFEWRNIPKGAWQGNGHLDIIIR